MVTVKQQTCRLPGNDVLRGGGMRPVECPLVCIVSIRCRILGVKEKGLITCTVSLAEIRQTQLLFC